MHTADPVCAHLLGPLGGRWPIDVLSGLHSRRVWALHFITNECSFEMQREKTCLRL